MPYNQSSGPVTTLETRLCQVRPHEDGRPLTGPSGEGYVDFTHLRGGLHILLGLSLLTEGVVLTGTLGRDDIYENTQVRQIRRVVGFFLSKTQKGKMFTSLTSSCLTHLLIGIPSG